MIKIEAIFYVVLKINNRRTWEYWPEVLAVRTATTEGQYSPVRPEQARSVSFLLYGTLFLIAECTSGGLRLKMFVFFIYL